MFDLLSFLQILLILQENISINIQTLKLTKPYIQWNKSNDITHEIDFESGERGWFPLIDPHQPIN